MTLERCNCMALRKAARRVSNFYDSVLAPSGLRTTQYSILALLSEVGEVSINDLARHLDLDRTTTGKNLRPLRVARLVKIAPSPDDGRSRLVTLTEGGVSAQSSGEISMLDKVSGSDSISLRLPNQALFFTDISLPREYRGGGRRLPVNGYK